MEADKKIDCWVTNPPYTDGTTSRCAIYPQIIENCLNRSPEAVAIICPTELFKSRAYVDLRNKLLNNYNVTYVKYLSPPDWLKQQVKCSTLGFVANKSNGEYSTTVDSATGGQYQIDLRSTPIIVDFEDYRLAELIIRIQTSRKWQFKGTSGTKTTALCVTTIFTSGNFGTALLKDVPTNSLGFYKVVIGYLRSNVVLLVPPEVGVGGVLRDKRATGHRYINFENKALAIKFRDYLNTSLIRLIANFSRTSTTADAPQFYLIPHVDLNQFDEVNDDTVNSYFKVEPNVANIIYEKNRARKLSPY
jgi:hypothetical protein